MPLSFIEPVERWKGECVHTTNNERENKKVMNTDRQTEEERRRRRGEEQKQTRQTETYRLTSHSWKTDGGSMHWENRGDGQLNATHGGANGWAAAMQGQTSWHMGRNQLTRREDQWAIKWRQTDTGADQWTNEGGVSCGRLALEVTGSGVVSKPRFHNDSHVARPEQESLWRGEDFHRYFGHWRGVSLRGRLINPPCNSITTGRFSYDDTSSDRA